MVEGIRDSTNWAAKVAYDESPMLASYVNNVLPNTRAFEPSGVRPLGLGSPPSASEITGILGWQSDYVTPAPSIISDFGANLTLNRQNCLR